MIDKQKNVLVVDDVQSVIDTVVNILKVFGYRHFISAQNGLEAFEKLSQSGDSVSLIISDWKMPKMTGVELLKKVRKDPKLARIPFLLLTSKSEAEDIALASDYKVSGYIVKPISIQAFEEKLKEIEEGNLVSIVQDIETEIEELCEKEAFNDALEKLGHYIRVYPKAKTRLLIEMAQVLYLKGDFDGAEELVDRSLQQNSRITKGWNLKSAICEGKGCIDLSTKCIQKAIEISPQNYEFHFKEGDLHLTLENYEAAKKSFFTAINMAPKNSELKNRIWNSYLERGKVDLVVKDFEAHLFDDLNVTTLNNQGVALRKQGKIDEAIKLYKRALTKYPENKYLLYNQAVAFLEKRQIDLAINALRQALIQDGSFDLALTLLQKLESKNKNVKSN